MFLLNFERSTTKWTRAGSLRIGVHHGGRRTAYLTLQGNLLLGPETGALRDTCDGVLVGRPGVVVVDLNGVRHIDPAGLGLLVVLAAAATRQGSSAELQTWVNCHDLPQTVKLLTVFEQHKQE